MPRSLRHHFHAPSTRSSCGMQRAKDEGKHVGRPPIPEDTQAKVRHLYEQDVSINQIANRLDIAYGTACRTFRWMWERER